MQIYQLWYENNFKLRQWLSEMNIPKDLNPFQILIYSKAFIGPAFSVSWLTVKPIKGNQGIYVQSEFVFPTLRPCDLQQEGWTFNQSVDGRASL